MIDRIINMVIRQVVRKLVGQGVNAAMKKGGEAIAKRGQRKQAVDEEGLENDQHPTDTARRSLHADERTGDDVLYPTDDYTEGMQPRR